MKPVTMRYGVLVLFVVTMICSCRKDEALNKFADPQFVAIADLQDRRSGDSLLAYLKNDNPAYRAAAAVAFGSIQDSAYIGPLQKLLLEDSDTTVRKAAAYAMGQIPSLTSEQGLVKIIAQEKDISVLQELIQSYGKVAKIWHLTIDAQNIKLSEAMAWSYYRMAVRGVSDQNLNLKCIALLKAPEPMTRLAAAHYFARGAKEFDQHRQELITAAKEDESVEVRMAAVLALRKVKSDSARSALEFVIKNDSDYRVKVNAVRALQDFPFNQTKNILIAALSDPYANVGIAASETIKASMTKVDWSQVNEVARTVVNWRIQANLYEGALAVSDHKELTEEIKSVYSKSTNPYQKSVLLNALQHSLMSYGFVREQLLSHSEPVIKSAAASSLVAMNYHKNFDRSLKSQFAKLYQEAIHDGDVAVIGTIATALADSTLDYRSEIKDFSFLNDARTKLSLPKDFEARVPLEAAIAYFEGKTPPSLKNKYNHPVPWHIVKKIPSDQKAIIKTSKGDISIRLLVDEAPGSVANFVDLSSKKYYDGKFFHRVVPNFVVQAGCPRGDGWGGEAYSIRSEFFPRKYTTGSIGMASAGRDTEGTQWFITHSPTPHLEGRYTQFGEVEKGMDVVDKIEVGDSILSIQIINFTPL